MIPSEARRAKFRGVKPRSDVALSQNRLDIIKSTEPCSVHSFTRIDNLLN